MKLALLMLMILLASTAAADAINFDAEKVGMLPAGWVAGRTGSGSPKWSVETDPTAPSPPNVLKQSGQATFPWCVKWDVHITDGYVEARIKPIAGKEDQAAGVVWRWKDGDNYYVARANALEDNVGLYRTEAGKRSTIKSYNVKVPSNQWHKLRVEFAGNHITVSFNGKPVIEQTDDHISGSGAVGVWTKADSVSEFDDFGFGSK